MTTSRLRPEVRRLLRNGTVIPAHPLALTADRQLDECHQRALTRYYLDAGAGGVAVGVHTTQFEIRDAKYGLLEPVLRMAVEEMKTRKPEAIRIAGICGQREQALKEARLAAELGYDIGLVSLSALGEASTQELVEHCRAVGEVLPIMGFYLQPAVGGRRLSLSFWRELCSLDAVVAIKIAPFDRYSTIDVVRAIAETGRKDDIALYTGNDDHIIADLVSPFRIRINGKETRIRIVGGLLGQWAVWTRRAVELFNEIRKLVDADLPVGRDLLALGWQITEANQAIFDPQHGFAGCIPGINEVLRRSGLMVGRWCLNPDLDLSPGQEEELNRIYRLYPNLTDDAFVREHIEEWLT